MKRWSKRAVGVLCVWMACLGAAFGACRLPDDGEPTNMSSLMQAGIDCAKAGRMEDAGKLYYALSVRMRALAYVDKAEGGTKASVKGLQKNLGAPVNKYLGGDLDQWANAIEWANQWDQDAPWPEAKTLFAKAGADDLAMQAARAKSRQALAKMAADVRAIDKESFYAKRRAAGLHAPAASLKK